MADKICNVCGKKLGFFDIQENFTIERELGYGTTHDGDTLELHICCDCMDKLISGCKVSPIIERE